jgi:hypothetical protein
MSRKESPPESLADDILWGIKGKHGIAAELGLKAEQVYYMHRRGQLPIRRVGHRTLTASRTALRAWLAGNNPPDHA